MHKLLKHHQKYFFLMTLLSTMMILSSSSWMSAWMGLEINLISFISLIIINKYSFSIEASIIYFIFQSIASIMFLYSIIMYFYKLKIMFNMILFMKILLFSLMIKIGAAPIHYWLPITMNSLNWKNNFLLMTWQKIGPLWLIFNSLNLNLMIWFIILSSFTGAIGGLYQSSLKKMMAYSSIGQVSWLLTAMILSKTLLKIYFSIYSFILINMLFILNKFNLLMINQMYNLKNKIMIVFIFFNMFSMGGMPPFLGFFPKLLIIMNLTNYFLLMILILSSLITLIYYTRMIYFTLLMNYSKNMKYYYLKLNLNFMMMITLIMNFILLIYIFY